MARITADLLICLRFFSRLPLPATPREAALGANGLSAAIILVPLAGAVIGCGPALILLVAGGLALPAPLTALIAIATLILVSGALHEDGLADCADGFGGGRSRERKLEIMRDSRIGTFGACAVALSVSLRAASLASLIGHGSLAAATALVASTAVSRTLCLLPLVVLPPARASGLGAAAGRLAPLRFGWAAAASAVVACLPLTAGTSLTHLLASYAAAWAAACCAVAVARQQIGGQSGDVAGATQQLSEIAMLVALTSSL